MRNGLSLCLALVLSVLTLASQGGCSTYRDQLVRAQRTFEQNEHERTLGLLRALELDSTRLTVPEQAQYAYLRGMTDYRIGHRADARHWLSIAKAHDDASTGTLPADWKARTNEALDELNNVVYTEGVPALSASKKPTPGADGRDAKP